jgi:hypothetical protein
MHQYFKQADLISFPLGAQSNPLRRRIAFIVAPVLPGY